jgi:hypothetical protein
VATPFVQGDFFAGADVDGVLSAEAVALAALDGLRAGKFAILPHPRVADYARGKAEIYERWIGGMAKLRRAIKAARPAGRQASPASG